MKVKDVQFFAVVSSFLNVYLVKNRSCSSNTVKSYEDALNLFFTFLETAKAIPRQRANWSHFTRQNIQEFMDWLEKVRNCSRQTQLQRLAAIRSFVRYGGIIDLRVISIQADVEKIRYRKPATCFGGLSYERRTLCLSLTAKLSKTHRVPEYGVSGFNVRYSCTVSGNAGFKDTGFSAAQDFALCLSHR